MKRILIAMVLILMLGVNASAKFKVQGQMNTMGTGLGVGYKLAGIPFLADFGVEAKVASTPWQFTEKGSYTDELTTLRVEYEGTLSWKGTRLGVYTQLKVPFLNPTIHVGTQSGVASLDGDLRIPGAGAGISEVSSVEGSYISIGFPFYVGPVFVEASFGTQSLYVPGYANYHAIPEFEVACGISI